MNSEKSKSKRKTNLIKTASSSKKAPVAAKYSELTFVENHVDTFYVGLRDQHQPTADNPMHGKIIDLSDQIVKDWVNLEWT